MEGVTLVTVRITELEVATGGGKKWERTWACLRHVLGGGGRVCPCFYLNRIVYVTTTITKMPQLGISIWMLNSTCQFLQNSLLGLLFELHWIYRSNFGQLITILSFPTHKQGIYLYLFKSFEIFLSNSFQFLVKNSAVTNQLVLWTLSYNYKNQFHIYTINVKEYIFVRNLSYIPKIDTK